MSADARAIKSNMANFTIELQYRSLYSQRASTKADNIKTLPWRTPLEIEEMFESVTTCQIAEDFGDLGKVKSSKRSEKNVKSGFFPNLRGYEKKSMHVSVVVIVILFRNFAHSKFSTSRITRTYKTQRFLPHLRSTSICQEVNRKTRLVHTDPLWHKTIVGGYGRSCVLEAIKTTKCDLDDRLFRYLAITWSGSDFGEVH